MIECIGRKQPKIFAIIDFTSGFHQALLDPDSRHYTAFITPDGLYEWARVPMGNKGAPTYFQHNVGVHVLGNLLHTICELYIDDCIVFGWDEGSFVENLRAVLEKILECNVNPEKCQFGLDKVEYVGHVIDATGKKFSLEKIAGATNFSIPTSIKGVRGFIGMANYFSDYVADMSGLLRPLRDVVKTYHDTGCLMWTSEAREAFEKVKRAIQENEKLFFYDGAHGQVFVYTDASDYGIGAYVCQRCRIDGEDKEFAIGYYSRALTPQEQRWTTIEKECYAIVATFKKFDYLLRDISFTLYTDHRNLTFLKTPLTKSIALETLHPILQLSSTPLARGH
jgi:hypothetical protein